MTEYTAAIPFEAPPHIVFGAIQVVGQQDKGKIHANHNGWRRLLLKQKRSLINWGNLVWFEVAPGTHPGNCVVNLEVSLAPEGHESPSDGLAHKSQGKKYIKKVQETLGQRPEPMGDFQYDRRTNQFAPWDGQKATLPHYGFKPKLFGSWEGLR